MLLVRHGASDPVPVGRTQREKAVFPKKVREQLSLKCQIRWPETVMDSEKCSPKQIDTRTRYGKWSSGEEKGGGAQGGDMKSK